MNKKIWSFFIVTVLLVIMTTVSAVKGSLEIGVIDLFKVYLQGQMKMLKSLKIYVSRASLLHFSLERRLLFLVCFSKQL